MRVGGALRGGWRKNERELRGLFNAALPEVVTTAMRSESIGGVLLFCYHLMEAEQIEVDLVHLARSEDPTLRRQDLIEYLPVRRISSACLWRRRYAE